MRVARRFLASKMSQDAHSRFTSAQEIDTDLNAIMVCIHDKIVGEAPSRQAIDYRKDANIAGDRKVADAISAYGVL